MTFISSNRFRPEKFGTLYGLGIFSAGLFGLLEYPCYTAVNVLFDRDPFWVRNSLIYKLVIVSSNADINFGTLIAIRNSEK